LRGRRFIDGLFCLALGCPSADLFLLDIVRPPLRKGRYAPPVHMIKLTETREITPYVWVHPDEER